MATRKPYKHTFLLCFTLFDGFVQADIFRTSFGKNEHPSESPVQSTNFDEEFLNESIVYTTLAGKVSPFLSKFLLSRDELKKLWDLVVSKTHFEDMLLMVVLGYLTVPFLKFLYQILLQLPVTANKRHQKHRSKEQQSLPRSAPVSSTLRSSSFRSTRLYLVSIHVQQIAKIALVVYAVDLAKLLGVGLGIDWIRRNKFPHAFAQLAYLLWFARRLAVGKKIALRAYVSSHPETYGRLQVANRLINAAIISCTSFLVLNVLKVQMGVAVGSFLAVGSIGTLALGLASQGITTQILNGLLLASSDRVYEGDVVRFGNGLGGTIVSLGWLETVIRGPDEVLVSVPNTDLIKQQVSNLSRVRFSHVNQVLKFRYSDAEKLPLVIESIKNAIYADCPSLITDGSRPFRVHWTSYESDGLEVTVDAHFRIRVLSDEYHENREKVLMAIRRGVTAHGIYFAKEEIPKHK